MYIDANIIEILFVCYCVSPVVYTISLASPLPQFGNETGILHTLPDFARWHVKEESTVDLFKKRLGMLRKIKYSPIIKFYHRNRKRFRNPKYLLLQWKLFTKIEKNHFKQLKFSSVQNHFKEPSVWVDSADLGFSVLAFTFLEEFNLLNPSNMSTGLTIDTHFGGSLNEWQCAEIGIFALIQDVYHLSVQWLELAKQKAGNYLNLMESLVLVASQQHNRNALQIQGPSSKAASNIFISPITIYQPSSQRISARSHYFEKHKSSESTETNRYTQAIDLCMGNNLPGTFTQSRLRCYFERKRHPYFYISPVKTEVLSDIPLILQFYDVLSTKQIENLKTRFHPLVKPESNLRRGAFGEIRCGNHARTGLYYDEGPRKFFQLSERLSGLNIIKLWNQNLYAEYSYGRLYHFHIDHSLNNTLYGRFDEVKKFGDRCATLLYYLEIPEVGGHTPFLDVGLFANPVKGSAIFWYSMYRNGTLRFDVTHGSCPVIHGEKIIVNHFFRYNSNWNRMKCTLNQME